MSLEQAYLSFPSQPYERPENLMFMSKAFRSRQLLFYYFLANIPGF